MLRVTTTFTDSAIAGGPYFNQLYFDGSTSGEADAANDIVRDFWIAMEDAFALSCAWITANEVEFVDPVSGQITGIEAVPPRSGVGDATGQHLSPASQGLLRWRTGVFVNGKEIRGRTFVPSPTEDINLDGIPSAGYLPVLDNAGAAMIAGAAGAGGLVIWSRTHGQRAQVVSASAWNRWAVLRSRRD